jgi:hypothetical protein
MVKMIDTTESFMAAIMDYMLHDANTASAEQNIAMSDFAVDFSEDDEDGALFDEY